MAFGSSIRDGDGVIPIAQGYVPGTGFRAQMNSGITFTDASSNTSTSVVVNEAVIETVLRSQNFVASSGFQTNGATGNFVCSIFNASTNTKNVLIYSILVIMAATSGPVQVNAVTTNPAWGTNVTPLNNAIGSATSSALPAGAISLTTATQTLGSNTAILVANRPPQNSATELLTNYRTLLLPVGVSQGITTYLTPSGASTWLVTYSWIEF